MDDPIADAEALIAGGNARKAADDLRARLAAGRGGALARITLVKALLASDETDAALEEARQAVALNPDVPQVITALGAALLQKENLPLAIAEFQRALRLDPDYAPARLLAGRAWLQAGEADKALEYFQALEPSDEQGALIAHAHGIKTAQRSDPGYVRHLFDQFAVDYDQRMTGPLSYAAPQILAALADLVMPGREQLSILDLGCGTGLAGMEFRARARRLDGVDLSPAMIAKARARNIYDALAVADLETAMAADGDAYGLILAADTLVYLGDLQALFGHVAKRLAPDGYFLFTTERAEQGFELGPKRRWRHSEAYLREMSANAGLAVAGMMEAAPRTEAGQPVPGLAAALHRD